MTRGEPSGRRANQLHRTRKDLLQAAARLVREGRQPSLEEIARAAMVSRATAYRYFPDAAALLVEASLDIGTPEADEVLAGAPPNDPVARLARVDAALEAMIRDNETALRLMLKHSMDRSLQRCGDKAPLRQNRRTPLLQAALAPAARQFRPSSYRMLVRALALVVGTESRLVLTDVLQLDDDEARKVRRWAIGALVAAARKPEARGG